MDTALDITCVNADGDGVATFEGRPVTVPGTIPGERVTARLRQSRDGSRSGEAVRILVASPHRVTPRCRHFGPCGGCAWQHIAYAEQLRLKQRRVQELTGADVLQTLPTPSDDGGAPWGFRDKVSFVFGPGRGGKSIVMGHFPRASRTVLPVEECPVHAEAGNRFAFGLRDALERAHVSGAAPDGAVGVARHVVVRVAEGSGELVGTLVVSTNTKALRRVTEDIRAAAAPGGPGVARPGVGFHLNLNDRPGPYLFGRETRKLFGLAEVRDVVGRVSYLVSPTAFFQTNVRAADVLVRAVLDALPARRFRRILDLYAGVGLFALPLAMGGRVVTAVEENRAAMDSAAVALGLNRVSRGACRLVTSRVEDAIGRLGPGRSARRNLQEPSPAWDAIVLDPPRQGCPPRVLDWVFDVARPGRVVYVSCNPEALARDLAGVSGSGYGLERVQPIDMFPHTAHVETVVVLEQVLPSKARSHEPSRSSRPDAGSPGGRDRHDRRRA